MTVEVSEPVNASGLFAVVLEFSVDNWSSINYIPMAFNGTHYYGVIMPNPPQLIARFHVVAYDNAMNIATTSEVVYRSVEPNTGGLIGDNLYLIIGIGVVIVLLLICMFTRRRK